MLQQILSKRVSLLIVLILAASLTIAVIIFATYRATRERLNNETAQHISTILNINERSRKLANIFADIYQLKHVFLEHSDLLQKEEIRLDEELESIYKTQQSQLLPDLSSSLDKLFEIFNKISTTQNQTQEIFQTLQYLIDNSERYIGKTLVEETLLGNDTSFYEQLLVLIVGYNESLLEIDRMWADLDDSFLYSQKDSDIRLILSTIDDLYLRLQTVSASIPEIANNGHTIIRNLLLYREKIVQYSEQFEILTDHLSQIEEIRVEFNTLTKSHEKEMNEAIATAHSNLSSTLYFSSLILLLLTLSIFFALGSAILFLFRKMDRELLYRKKIEEELEEYKNHLEDLVAIRDRELKRANESLLQKEKLAAIGQLSGSVAHDIRNPLGSISNSIYFLDKSNFNPDDHKFQKHLSIMKKEIINANTIISDLMDFSRETPPAFTLNQLNVTITDAIEELDIPEKTNIKTKLSSSLKPFYYDITQIKRVIYNLLNNAIQAMDNGGTVLVTTKETIDKVTIEVIDEGIGIEQKYLGKICEPLVTTKPKGVGLGLSIVKTFVERHQGSINFHSEPGKGTTVVFTLPLREKK